MNNTDDKRWQIFDNPEAVAEAACQRILTVAQQAIDNKQCFRLVLAGGRTPEQTYRLLAKTNSEWSYWHIYYGDERCLPESDPERNSVMASQAWLNHVAIPTQQIHIIPGHLGAKSAAHFYNSEIQNAVPFDMVLLGMGEDGHTASLFPNCDNSTSELVQAIFNAPKPPPERVSLSAEALSNTMELLFLVTGQNKQTAVTQWRQGKNLPVAQIQARVQTTVLIDTAAMDESLSH